MKIIHPGVQFTDGSRTACYGGSFADGTQEELAHYIARNVIKVSPEEFDRIKAGFEQTLTHVRGIPA